MCELAMCLFAIVAIIKIARHEDQSPWVWGAITFVICFLCLLIPLPFIRVLIALVASFSAMIIWNVIDSKR